MTGAEIAELEAYVARMRKDLAMLEALLTTVKNGKAPAPATHCVAIMARSGQPLWYEKQVREVIRLLDRMATARKPYKGAWALLGLCVKRPDEWFSFPEVHKLTGSARSVQTQADIGVFTKCVTDVRGNNAWPIEDKLINGVRHYRCSPAMAAWIAASIRLSGRGITDAVP